MPFKKEKIPIQLQLKKHVFYICTMLFCICFIYFGHKIASDNLRFFDSPDRAAVIKARVVSVISKTSGEMEQIDIGFVEPIQLEFEAKILGGDLKGTTVKAIQQNGGYSPAYLKEVAVNDKVLLYNVIEQENGIQWVLQEFIRTDTLIVLGIVFMIILLLFGRGKGFNTILSLGFTALAIFFVFIPSILAGHNIYISTVVVSFFIILMTLLLVNGPNLKSLSAGIGCLGGLTIAGILTLVMDIFLKLTGIVDEESIYLLSINPANPMDLKAIIFASIVIGALGATLDVSVSIASSLNEIFETSGKRSFTSMIKSGMNIGRDIMGTMTNTLILAYIGGSLSLALLLIVYNNSLVELLNREMVVVEILHALVGSIGMLCSIPLTSVVSAFVYHKSIAKLK